MIKYGLEFDFPVNPDLTGPPSLNDIYYSYIDTFFFLFFSRMEIASKILPKKNNSSKLNKESENILLHPAAIIELMRPLEENSWLSMIDYQAHTATCGFCSHQVQNGFNSYFCLTI